MSKSMGDYVDAGLTPKGRKQAEEAGALLRHRGVELVVASPTERAIQTALGLFPARPPGRAGKIVAMEEVREMIFK